MVNLEEAYMKTSRMKSNLQLSICRNRDIRDPKQGEFDTRLFIVGIRGGRGRAQGETLALLVNTGQRSLWQCELR